MRRYKSEVVILGSGGAAVFAANRFASLGMRVALVNPAPEFDFHDLYPHDGLGLWNAAYRQTNGTSLADLYDLLVARMRELFPATVSEAGLAKTEYWSILSSTVVHRSATEELEREFFRLERKPWSAGQFRLVNPEHIVARAKRLGVDLVRVAQVEGAVVRAYGLWWDAPKIGRYLSQFLQAKFPAAEAAGDGPLISFVNASIKGRFGRRLVLLDSKDEEVSLEAERGIYIFVTGELLPSIRSIAAACEESWIQGVRKRRREQHFALFDRGRQAPPAGQGVLPSIESPVWMELGNTRFYLGTERINTTWQSQKGPDGMEHVLDESMRLQTEGYRHTRFVRAQRAFSLAWDWKNPQWRETSHQTYWATAFEGDLWNIMELLWNLPSH